MSSEIRTYADTLRPGFAPAIAPRSQAGSAPKHAKNSHIPKAGMSHEVKRLGKSRGKHAKNVHSLKTGMCHEINHLDSKAAENKRKITSTTQSWNVMLNQQHRSKTWARPKAGMSFRISKKGATSISPKTLFFVEMCLESGWPGATLRKRMQKKW